MRHVALLVLLLVTAGAIAEPQKDAEQSRLSAVLGAFDHYVFPGKNAAILYGTAGVFSIHAGSAGLTIGTLPKRVGIGSIAVGSSFVVLGVIGAHKNKTRKAEESENAFLASDFYGDLKAKLGEDGAKDFYQDLRAGVGIHYLVKHYSPGPLSVAFLNFFRQERERVAKVVPENLTDRQARLDLIDVIAARRAAFRMVAVAEDPEEGARITAMLARDLEELRIAAAATPGGSPPHPVPDGALPKTHD